MSGLDGLYHVNLERQRHNVFIKPKKVPDPDHRPAPVEQTSWPGAVLRMSVEWTEAQRTDQEG